MRRPERLTYLALLLAGLAGSPARADIPPDPVEVGVPIVLIAALIVGAVVLGFVLVRRRRR